MAAMVMAAAKGDFRLQAATGEAKPLDVADLYRRYGPMVLRRCRSMLKDEQLALDAMQDTFVRLVGNAARLDDTSPGGLVFRVATNVCLVKLRSKRRRPESSDEGLLQAIAHVEDPSATALARATLDRVFRDELDSTRTMAVLHLVDGMSLDEVAAATGFSRSGVRKRLNGLLQRVAAQVPASEAREPMRRAA